MRFCTGKCLCRVYLLRSREKRVELCISGCNGMQQPYIESATAALSDKSINQSVTRIINVTTFKLE